MLLPVALALAQDPDVPPSARYAGWVVAQRALVAPEGGLPDESLEPLLRVQQDVVYDPSEVRQDIAMLHRALDVARIEVDVEPWPYQDAAGNPIDAVRVEYRVWPPPRLRQIRFTGNRVLGRRALLGATGLDAGDPFYADDAASLEKSVRDAYAEEGYPRAAAVVVSRVDADGRLDVLVEVTEGSPQRVAELRLRAADAIPAWEARWILGRHGIVEGRPWTPDRLREAREALTDELRARGWYEAKVSVRADALDEDDDRLVIIVDPRRRWEIAREARGLPSRRRIEETLGLREGARTSRGFADEAGRLLTEELRARSWLEADVDVTVEETDTRVVLHVAGEVGARHRLARVRFEGETIWSQRYLREALDEASPELLARGRVTPPGVDAALEALQEFYRSQGYLDAELTRLDFVEGAGRRALGVLPPVVPVEVRVAVAPGPRTTLRSVTVDGDVEGLDEGTFFAEVVGSPLNPAEIEARSRKLVEALNERGHLDADARVHTRLDADDAHVTIELVPGPVVYLRTVVLRGYRRTRRSVIEREVDVHTGDPLAPSEITDLRTRLYELDLFQRVSTELVGDEDRVKDLVVTVEEKSNLYFEGGLGVATDQGIRVFSRQGHRNLFGLGHRFATLGQVGVGWAGSGWSLDLVAPEWKAAARYEAPHIPGPGDRVALDVLLNEQEQEPTWRLQRTGGGLAVSLDLGLHGSAQIAYRLQWRRLHDVDPGALVAGDPWLDELGLSDVADPDPTFPSAVRTQSGLDLSLVLDRRDDPFNPTAGALGSAVLTLSDEVLSDVAFVRAEGSWTQYLPAGPLGLMLRARGGAAWVPGAGTTLPLEERFRLGGGANLRGFDLDSVGPANEVSQERIDYPDAIDPILDYASRDAAPRWVPTGGDAMALATFEVRVPFEVLGLAKWQGTQLALFGDVGNVWLVAEGVSTDSAAEDPLARFGVGAGLRRETVIGPIQVDFGFNPARLPEREEELVRLHVSLGAL
ncbi:MAG: POTRA domain-containing protein [Myxococcota bacterium]